MKNKKSKFKNKVFKVVKRIPKGRVLAYKDVAKLAGKPKAYRVVGNILGENFDPKIPCHRVVRSDGKVGGYNKGENKKIILLKKEKVVIVNRLHNYFVRSK